MSSKKQPFDDGQDKENNNRGQTQQQYTNREISDDQYNKDKDGSDEGDYQFNQDANQSLSSQTKDSMHTSI